MVIVGHATRPFGCSGGFELRGSDEGPAPLKSGRAETLSAAMEAAPPETLGLLDPLPFRAGAAGINERCPEWRPWDRALGRWQRS